MKKDMTQNRKREDYLVLPSYVQGLEKIKAEEGKTENTQSFNTFGIVTIHVFSKLESMTSKHTEMTQSFLRLCRRLPYQI